MANTHEGDQFVVHHDGKWAVRGGGNSKVTKIFDTQKEATAYAIVIARNKQSDVSVQDKEGKFHKAYSYGNDPHPPVEKNY